jgi:uncharacterized RDD family membrane protein YckC
MKTCTRCGIVNPDSSNRCECGGALVAGDTPMLVDARLAGFWIRLGADLLDALVLGVVGFVIAAVFRARLLAWGERAVLLGAPITLLYSGVLHSHFGRGQTLAKRLLGLRVLRLDGEYLSLDRSVVRWAIMGVVFYGSSVASALSAVVPVGKMQRLPLALSGAQLALILGCALLVPFHPLKRGLHDLLTGSIVIRRGRFPSALVAHLRNPRRDRLLLIVAASVAILATLGGLLAARNWPAAFQPGLRVMVSMAEMGIQNPGVGDSSVKGPGVNRHQIIASGYLPTSPDGSPRVEDAAKRILALVRKEMPLEGVDSIMINLREGINLGIYKSYEFTNLVEPAVATGAPL